MFRALSVTIVRNTLTVVVSHWHNYSYCTPDDGYGKYPKHVQWSCNEIKILTLYLVGHFMCIFIENNARNHEVKMSKSSYSLWYDYLKKHRLKLTNYEVLPYESYTSLLLLPSAQFHLKVKVKPSHYRPGQVHNVPVEWGSQISRRW
jgi:hypothetical protein